MINLPITNLLANPTPERIKSSWRPYCFFDYSDDEKVSVGQQMLENLKDLIGSSKFDPEKCCVSFTNSYILPDTIYESFAIESCETGETFFIVVPQQKGYNGEIWGIENYYHKPLVIGSWEDIKNWFKDTVS